MEWNEYNDGVTIEGESIGPWKIRPLELESCEELCRFDYQKSDVYLFAKTAWIFLKNDYRGFRGQYTSGDQQICLGTELYNGVLEPLHEMMEKATEEKFKDRITIEQCIEYMLIQEKIITNDLSQEKCDKWKKKNILRKIKDNTVPDKEIYQSNKHIEFIMSMLVEINEVMVYDKIGGNRKTYQISTADYNRKNRICIFYQYIQNYEKRVYFKIDKIEMYEKKNIKIILQPCDIQDIEQEGDFNPLENEILNENKYIYVKMQEDDLW